MELVMDIAYQIICIIRDFLKQKKEQKKLKKEILECM